MKIPKFDIFSYAFISLPVAFASIPIYIFLPQYYHVNYGVDLAMLSITLFSLRILDAVIDPIIGWYCDTFQNLTRISFIVVVIFFILGMYITCSPIFSNKLLNLFVGIFLATFSFSYITIFVTTKGALWFKDDNSKSVIISVREIFNIIGVLIASILPFALSVCFPQQQSYFIYSFVASILMIVASSLFIYWLTKINNYSFKEKRSLKFIFLAYFRSFNIDGFFLFLTYTISALGSAIPAVMLVFFSTYILNSIDFTGIYIFLYFLGAVIFIPVVKKIAMQIGIINNWSCSLLFCVFIFFIDKLLIRSRVCI